MKVYVVTAEPYHENSTVLGAFSSLEKAKNTFPGEWDDDGYYVNWANVVSCTAWKDTSMTEDLFIYEFEIDEES